MDFLKVPILVEKPHGGRRLDVFLAARLHGYTRSRVQGLISQGRVLWRGRPAKASSRVAEGEPVVLLVPPRVDRPSRHEALEVLHEDGLLLAVNKPGDVLSHPTDKVVKNSVTEILKKQFSSLRLHLAHRLDRETSGVLLLAKSPAGARALHKAFLGRSVAKEYWAIVEGRVGFKTRTVDQPLGYAGHAVRLRQAVTADGAPARTRLRLLDRGPEASLVAAFPETGRLHQIRAHLAHLGHPIAGDKVYAGEGESFLKLWRGELGAGELRWPRQMLHARALSLKHPETGKALTIEAPLPADFREALSGLGLSAGGK